MICSLMCIFYVFYLYVVGIVKTNEAYLACPQDPVISLFEQQHKFSIYDVVS